MSTALVTVPETLPAALQQECLITLPPLMALLPADVMATQFQAGLWLILEGNEKLRKAPTSQVMSAVVKSAMAGLIPGRDCQLLPFWNRTRQAYDVSYVPEYQGLMRVVLRTGQAKRCFALPVYDGDVFELDPFADHPLHHPWVKPRPDAPRRGTFIGAYAYINLKNGFTHFEFMTKEQIDKIRDKAPGRDQEPWQQHYDEQAKKTVLKRVLKMVQLSPEVAAVVEATEPDHDDTEHLWIHGERAAQDLFETAQDSPPGARQPRPNMNAEHAERHAVWEMCRMLIASLEEAGCDVGPAALDTLARDCFEEDSWAHMSAASLAVLTAGMPRLRAAVNAMLASAPADSCHARPEMGTVDDERKLLIDEIQALIRSVPNTANLDNLLSAACREAKVEHVTSGQELVRATPDDLRAVLLALRELVADLYKTMPSPPAEGATPSVPDSSSVPPESPRQADRAVDPSNDRAYWTVLWDQAMCGGKGGPAMQRRRLLLSVATGMPTKQIVQPRSLKDAPWSTDPTWTQLMHAMVEHIRDGGDKIPTEENALRKYLEELKQAWQSPAHQETLL